MQQLTAVTNGPTTAPPLLRSRDGGYTWRTLAPITTLQQSPVAVMNLVVVGSRIIASTSIFGEGQLPDDLVKSDDGGTTWQPLAQSIAGQHLLVENFSAAGNTIYLQSDVPCTECGASAPLNGQRGPASALALIAPLSSQPPTPPVFWKSTDAGNTWAKIAAIPGTLPVFSMLGTGTSYAGLSVAVPSPTAPVKYYLSDNGGTTWQQTVGLSGLENGYVDATASPASGLMAVDATGSMVTDTWHDFNSQGGGNDAGYFYVAGASSASEWLPLAPPGVQDIALAPGGAHGRLWGIEQATPAGPARAYVNLP